MSPRLPGGRHVLEWFPFHASAWIQDEWVRVMSPEARGAYVTLLSHEWVEGSLPMNAYALAQLAGWNFHEEQMRRCSPDDTTYSWGSVWAELEGHFERHPKLERLVNPTLERIRREQTAKRSAARKRKRESRNGHADSHTDVTAVSRPRSRSKKLEVRDTTTSSRKRETWVGTLGETWRTAYQGQPPHGQIGKHLKPLVDEHGLEAVGVRWGRYLLETDAQYASPARFAQTFGKWGGNGKPVGPQYQTADEADRKAGLLP